MDLASFLWGCFAGAFIAWTLALTLLVVLSYRSSKKDTADLTSEADVITVAIPKQRATRDDVR